MSVGAVNWIQDNLGVDIKGEWGLTITLNVGGTYYTTTRRTLRELADHHIFGPILRGHARKSEDDSFFIDRDGTLFRYVLNFLRDGRLVLPGNFSDWEQLLTEAHYFQLPLLEKGIRDSYEYQRYAFQRLLPHAVCVSWPHVVPTSSTTSAAASAALTTQLRYTAAGETTQHPIVPPASSHVMSAPGRTRAPLTSSATTGLPAEGTLLLTEDDNKRRPRSPAAGAAGDVTKQDTASATQSSTTDERVVMTLPRVSICPAVPALHPSDDGRAVCFEERRIDSLDELVLVLLDSYGYVLQHWNERDDKISVCDSPMLQRTLFDYVKKNAKVDGDGARSDAPDAVVDVDEPRLGAEPTTASSSRKHARPSADRDARPTGTKRCKADTSPNTTISSRWLAGLVTDPDWRRFLVPIMADSWHDGLFLKIERFLDEQYAQGKVIFPPRDCLFSAFNSAPFAELKVVLLGQDPYHNFNQAHGLCFSVLPSVPPPPSLVNMYKELCNDIPGFQAPRHGYLQSWAEQGMLMLNASLTVEAGKANSHSRCGWQTFTDAVIEHISRHHPNRLVFLLWGNFARKKKCLIDLSRHVVIENAHPSPLSAALWWNCRCFSKCNTALTTLGHRPMNWQLPLTVTVESK